MKKLTIQGLLYFQEEVIKWNTTFGNSVSDKSLINTYLNLSKEEFLGVNEYIDSYRKGDMEGRLDGLVDSIFTGFMWMALGGESLLGTETWIIALIADEGNSTLVAPSMDVTINEITESLEIEYLNGYKVHLIDLIIREQVNFDIRGAFDLVLQSNYSKAIHKKEYGNIDAELVAIQRKGRYDDLFSEENGDFIILRAYKDLEEGTYFPKGKIVKSPTYFMSVEALGGLNEFVYG